MRTRPSSSGSRGTTARRSVSRRRMPAPPPGWRFTLPSVPTRLPAPFACLPPYSIAMRRRALLVALVALFAGVLVSGALAPIEPLVPAARAADRDEVRILVGEPSTFDPARQNSVNDAAVSAQIYETLTAYD